MSLNDLHVHVQICSPWRNISISARIAIHVQTPYVSFMDRIWRREQKSKLLSCSLPRIMRTTYCTLQNCTYVFSCLFFLTQKCNTHRPHRIGSIGQIGVWQLIIKISFLSSLEKKIPNLYRMQYKLTHNVRYELSEHNWRHWNTNNVSERDRNETRRQTRHESVRERESTKRTDRERHPPIRLLLSAESGSQRAGG